MRDGFVAAASAKVWNGVAFLPLPPGAAPALTKTPQLSATTVGSLVGSPAQPGLPPPVPPVPPPCPDPATARRDPRTPSRTPRRTQPTRLVEPPPPLRRVQCSSTSSYPLHH